MPDLLTRKSKFGELIELAKSGEVGAISCLSAIRWIDHPRFLNRKFGVVMDAFLAEDANREKCGWASWALGAYRQCFDAEIRRGFLSAIDDPMTAYNHLKKGADAPAGDDWSEEERDMLRAVFRGKLPNVADAETL